MQLHAPASHPTSVDTAPIQQLIDQDRYEEAGERVSRELARTIADPRLWHCRGVVHFATGSIEAALKDFETAEVCGFEDVALNAGYRVRAHHLLDPTRLPVDLATRWADAARSTPQELDSLAFLALAEGQRAAVPLAKRLAKQVLFRSPEHAIGRLAAAEACLRDNAFASAEAHYASVLGRDPKSCAAWMGLGRIHVLTRDYLRGAGAFEQAAMCATSRQQPARALGWSLIAAGDPEAACVAFDERAPHSQAAAELQAGQACAHALLGRTVTAHRLIAMAGRSLPKNAGPLLDLEFAHCAVQAAEGPGAGDGGRLKDLLLAAGWHRMSEDSPQMSRDCFKAATLMDEGFVSAHRHIAALLACRRIP